MEIQESGCLIWTGCSLILCFGLFYLAELRKEARGGTLAGLCLGLGTLGGILGAKAAYYLCQIDFMIAEGWLESLLSLNPDGLSFFGGAAGVCGGVALAARIAGQKPVALLDRFAPYGLVLGALVRFGEYFLGMLGVGYYLENEALCFFPLAMGFSYGDSYTEWYLAVFVLEGISLLAVAAFSRWGLREHRFLRSVFWMCLPQILLENLRMSSMMWFFCIRVEQLACMVAMFVILILHGLRGERGARRFLPAGIALACAGLFIVCEFAMEGKISFLRFLNLYACYGLMALGQVILGVTEEKAFGKTRKAEREVS